MDSPLWTPSPDRVARAQVSRFIRERGASHALALHDQSALHASSIAQPEAFWRDLWDFCGVIGQRGERVLEMPERMPGARWFPEARLNFAENLLRDSPNGDAIVFWGEDKVRRRMSRSELRSQVARFACALRAQGTPKGARIAAFMPNMPETVVTALAAASVGGVFTSASPDFGVQGLMDRFGQTEPTVLVACDGYWYNGRRIDVMPKLREIVRQLPSLRRVVVVPYLAEDALDLNGLENAMSYTAFLSAHEHDAQFEPERLAFDHPLYVMYSSGTTGVPKCIVHGAGGTLLQHLKEHRLHGDIREGDRLFYFTTCGWMMWNWLCSGLASGATLLLYDGNPFVGDGRILWEYAAAERMSHFGTSAKYLDTLAKTGLRPGEEYDLSSLQVMFSTGSPLAPESFDYVYSHVKRDVQLSSISGGTDILSCFVLGSPILPVWRGEIQCRGLGMAVEVWDEEGKSVRGTKGELVCTRPFPSMPIGFWNDPDGGKYRAAYFERFPGVWCHGDFCEITAHDGIIIHGRSDATLNPGGVRIGTAEIYRQVEKQPEVLEAVVIGQEWEHDVRIVLFVKLRDGLALDEALETRIKQTIRANTTPRHVPAVIVQVGDIPRTKTGKVVELAVREVVHGRPVKNIDALSNPSALEDYRGRPELARE